MTRAEDVVLVTRCAWCERYAVAGAWVPESELDAVTAHRDPVRISHGICPACSQGVPRA